MNERGDDTSKRECAGFCTECGAEVRTFDGLSACPRCGTTAPPCSYDDQVTVSINTHELRILCIWAENWQSRLEKKSDVVYAIAARLRKQIADCPPLTMADEFMQLKECGYEFTTNHPAADNESTGDAYDPGMT